MKKNKIIGEKWQMIQFATQHGCVVRNEKGELVKVSDEYEDCVKCYPKFPYYYLSSADKYELTFDGMTYDEWHSNKVFDLQ